MKRLTIRQEDGQAVMDCEACEKSGFTCNLLGCRNRLKDRLAYYEDAVQQGRLVEQKRGQWIPTKTRPIVFKCDQCNYHQESRRAYCPVCGARMTK